MYSKVNSIKLREILGREIGAHIIKDKYFDFIKSENSCWPNVIFNLNLELSDTDDFITYVTEGISNGRLPDVLVSEIEQQGGELLNNITDRNFKVGHWAVMQHNLNKLESIETPNLQIKRVQTAKDLSEWMRICETELMKGKMDEKMFSAHLSNKDIPLFLAFENDVPVATSLIYVDNEESGLYFIATDNEFRRKGYGKAITNHALLYAKEKGCNVMYLEATDSGLPVYENLGFINYGPVVLVNFAKSKE